MEEGGKHFEDAVLSTQKDLIHLVDGADETMRLLNDWKRGRIETVLLPASPEDQKEDEDDEKDNLIEGLAKDCQVESQEALNAIHEAIKHAHASRSHVEDVSVQESAYRLQSIQQYVSLSFLSHSLSFSFLFFQETLWSTSPCSAPTRTPLGSMRRGRWREGCGSRRIGGRRLSAS